MTSEEIKQRITDIDSEIYSFNYHSRYPFDAERKLKIERDNLKKELALIEVSA